MFTIDSILITVIFFGAVFYLSRHYFKKWKSPKACGSGGCGCGQGSSKVFSKDKNS